MLYGQLEVALVYVLLLHMSPECYPRFTRFTLVCCYVYSPEISLRDFKISIHSPRYAEAMSEQIGLAYLTGLNDTLLRRGSNFRFE